ncbi:ArsO family NAD(P)H-dependent flavin-containing monooxygenase [Psychrobacter aquaticus]|uniref:Putative monooxygenase n=1 Tax=Psychrobacter aquaticus CMS 56 TaxID=1354303 RepID=U4TEV3_9GAMM|nr:ArsO family NAD(P)H-dependent flavin-containing monooxygenase [Psychrobacter aquaticus]ERL56998.1 putative monooxygenase [Psychrobacter aquaticus CMS 56]
MATKIFDTIIIGGGQAGLAVGYYLRRAGLDFIILDDQNQSGGAWQHTWPSLRLFSPAFISSLPGRLMPKERDGEYPHRDEVLGYLSNYEQHYQLPIYRPYQVQSIHRDQENNCLRVTDGSYTWLAKTVVSATGTWSNPTIPSFEGQQAYLGEQCHSAHYAGPDAYKGKRVLVVGGGNSGAQIYAELAEVANASWVTREPPLFLADDVDGHVLFERATARITGSSNDDSIGSIGDIVMVPPVKAARDKGILHSVPMFRQFTEQGVIWADGSKEPIDTVIWCTGFQPQLDHLASLNVLEADGKVQVEQGQAIKEPRLWLFGYGDWASPGSATLIGAGRSARENVPALLDFLQKDS